MKRILLAILAAGMLAVAISPMPMQVQEADARPDCQAVDHHEDGMVDISDVVDVADDPGAQGRVRILGHFFGDPC